MSKPIESVVQSGDESDGKMPVTGVENGNAEEKTTNESSLMKQDSMDCAADEEGLTEDTTDEEENLFITLEKEKEKEEVEESLHPHAQPIEVTEAPRLLQDALKNGEVQDDDSVAEMKKDGIVSQNYDGSNLDGVEPEGEPQSDEAAHVHQRVSKATIRDLQRYSTVNIFHFTLARGRALSSLSRRVLSDV
jgi:hypothetical protein